MKRYRSSRLGRVAIATLAMSGVSLLFPAVAGADTTPTTVTEQCVLEQDVADTADDELAEAVLGLTLARDGAEEDIAALVLHASNSDELSEIEAEVVSETAKHATEAVEDGEAAIEALEAAALNLDADKAVTIEQLTTVDQAGVDLDDRIETLKAELAVVEQAGLPTAPLTAVVGKLTVLKTATATARASLVKKVDSSLLVKYTAPTAATAGQLKDVRGVAADKITAATAAFAGELTAVKASMGELAALQDGVDASTVEAELLAAASSALAGLEKDLDGAQSSLAGMDAAVKGGAVAASAPLASIDSASASLAANMASADALASELAVKHEGMSPELQAVRESAGAALAAVKEALVAQEPVTAALSATARPAVGRSALAAYAKPSAPSASLFASPHPANAAKLDAASTALAGLDATAAAQSIDGALATATTRDLQGNLSAAFDAMSALATAEAGAREALAADRAVVADGGRFARPSEALSASAADMAAARSSLSKSATLLAGAALEGENAAARDTAVAAIAAVEAKLDGAAATFDAALATRAKYTLSKAEATKKAAATKEAAPAAAAATKEAAPAAAAATKEAAPAATREAAPAATREAAPAAAAATKEAAPAATREAAAAKVPTVVKGALATQENYVVIDGNSVAVLIAELGVGESKVTVSIDDEVTHGTLVLTKVGNTCQLTFTSDGCIGTETVDVKVEVLGEVETRTIEFEVVAAANTTTQTQAPAVLAFTGPATSQMIALAGITLLAIGMIFRRMATAAQVDRITTRVDGVLGNNR